MVFRTKNSKGEQQSLSEKSGTSNSSTSASPSPPLEEINEHNVATAPHNTQQNHASNGQKSKPNNKNNATSHNHKETIIIIVASIFCAIVFRSLILDPFRVPSGSMIPTLLPGDRMFAKKWSFGYSKYSFPGRIIPIKQKIFAKTPKRGEIAIFALPSQENVFYVKRVIAIEGDTVAVSNNTVYVNGIPLKTKLTKLISEAEYNKMSAYDDKNNQKGSSRSTMQLVEETSLDGIKYRIINPSHNFIGSNRSMVTVPQGHCFVMGDNRENSLDSRFPEVGFIPLTNIVAKPFFVFFSSEKNLLGSIVKPKSIRPKRIFQNLSTTSPAQANKTSISDNSLCQA